MVNIGRDKPYPTTGLTTERWLALPVELVLWDDVTTTQDFVRIDALLGKAKPYSADAYPHVVVHQRRMYLEDGHTRMVRDLLSGRHHGEARVYRP